MSRDDAAGLTVPDDFVSPANAARLQQDGFLVCPEAVIDAEAVERYRQHLDAVLHGTYDRGTPPTKAPNYVYEKLDKADKRRAKTLQVINIRHCDSAFAALVHSPALGEMVAKLAGWQGARVAQDQIWMKPPLAAALTYHRDTPYFNFVPNEIVTVWISFDDLTAPDAASLGPLEYYPGSHRWCDARTVGIATQFIDPDHRAFVKAAAAREGLQWDPTAVHTVVVPAGGLSLHNGATWHGSGPNTDPKRFRRGIGIHYARHDVVFRDGWLAPMWEAARAKHNGVDVRIRPPPAAFGGKRVDTYSSGGGTTEAGDEGAAAERADTPDGARRRDGVVVTLDPTVPEFECPIVWQHPATAA